MWVTTTDIKIVALAMAMAIVSIRLRGRCYDFLDIFAEEFGEKMAFLTQNKVKLKLNFDHNIGF
jgi:hypothetical protein